MQLTELFMDRFLYKAKQTVETLGADATASNIAPPPSNLVASGNTVVDINTNAQMLNGATLAPGTIPATTLDLGNWGWTQTCAFTSTDLDTISWGAGTFTSANGSTVLSISAGNTGNMSAKTYVYLDINVSTTTYQISTSVTASVGLGNVLIAVCENAAVSATYALVQATQIVGDNIVANTVNAGKLSVAQLSAITADLGSITAGTVTGALIRTASTSPRIQMSGSSNSFEAYDVGNNLVAKLGTSNVGLDIRTSDDTGNGVYVTGNGAGNGYYYSNNSNITTRGLYISQLNTGANNNLPSIEIARAGTGNSIFIADSGFATSTVYLSRTKAGNGIELAQNVAAGAADAVGITMSINHGSNANYALSLNGGEYVSSAVGGTQDRKIKILIGGSVYYIPAYTA